MDSHREMRVDMSLPVSIELRYIKRESPVWIATLNKNKENNLCEGTRLIFLNGLETTHQMDNGKKYKIGYTTGVYDMFHIDHLNVIRRAKEQCEHLIVGVTTDDLCYKRKKKYPIICEADRMEIVRAIKFVDEVVPQKDMDKLAAVKKYHVDAVFVGSDWKGTEAWNKYEKEFAEVGCSVVYLDHTEGISSTILRDRLNSGEIAL